MPKTTECKQLSQISNPLLLYAGTSCEITRSTPATGQSVRYSRRHYYGVCDSDHRFAAGPHSHADVITRGTEIAVIAVLPGIDKYIDISLTRIRAEPGIKREENGHYRCVISRGKYSIIVCLPVDVDTTRIKAGFGNGVLKLVIPKYETDQDA